MKTLQLRTGKAKAVAGVVLAVLTVLAVGGGAFLFAAAQDARSPEVGLTTATRASITNSVVAVADIEARDSSTITLSPTEKVSDVLVEKGQLVTRGDVLAVLDTSEYENRRVQQDITLSDLRATLANLSGPNATTTDATAQNAVSQARIGLENARAAQVTAGEQLAKVEGLGRATVRQAEIALEGAGEDARAAEANVASVRDLNGGAVRQAEIALDTAQVACDKAVRDLADFEEQLGSGLVSQREYDAQYAALAFARDNAENAVRSAQVGLETARVTAAAALAAAEKTAADASLAVTNARTTQDSATLKAEADLRGAQQAVADGGRAVRSAEIALSTAQNNAGSARIDTNELVSNQRSRIALVAADVTYLQGKVEQGRLRTPIDGVVSRVDAAAGQYPTLGDVIAVEGASGYVASLEVPQGDSVAIRPGQRATVTIKGTGRRFQGSVTAVAPVAERSATSADRNPKVTVEVAILAPDDTVRVGFEADVEVLVDEKADALQIGLDAVRNEPGTGSTYVWVVDDRNRVGKVFIRTGIENGDRVEVLSGLAEGQDCVVDPPDSLAAGTTVRIAGGRR